MYLYQVVLQKVLSLHSDFTGLAIDTPLYDLLWLATRMYALTLGIPVGEALQTTWVDEQYLCRRVGGICSNDDNIKKWT